MTEKTDGVRYLLVSTQVSSSLVYPLGLAATLEASLP